MRRAILATLLLLLVLASTLNWDLSLVRGLSLKNAFLYVIVGLILIETAGAKRIAQQGPAEPSLALLHAGKIQLDAA